jgi:hypothetical protein
MTTEVLVPLLVPQFFSNSGTPLVGGQLFSYQAGTNTPQATYTDSTGGTQNSNPVICNARGEVSVWVPPNTGYKFVLQDALGNTIWTRDQVTSSQLLTLFGGTDLGATNAYILTFTASFTSYSTNPVIYWVPSNNNTGASTLNVNGIGVVGIYNANGTQLGANQIVANQITGVIYQTNIANSGNSGFVLISVGNFTGSTIGTFGTETPIASAATTDLGSAAAHVVLITGTTTITSLGSSASLAAPIYIVRFSGALTLTYNAISLILPGSASIVTTAGDAMIAEYLGAGNWKVLLYQYTAGNANTKIKPGDTALTSNAVLTADPDLQSNMLAIGRYAYEVYLVFDSVAGGAGFQWTNGGTAVDSRGLSPALAYGWVNAGAYGPKADTFYGTTITYATVGTTADSNQVLYKGSLLVGTPGTFGISWAQAASTASATTLRAGSYITTTLLTTGASSGALQRIYTTAGTFVETVPTGYTNLVIECWGSSAGGGAGFTSGCILWGGGGGGSAGYARTTVSVLGLGGDTLNFTVGAAGTAGGAGNTSSVSSGTLTITTMTCTGGGAGTAATLGHGGNGGAGGTATGGTVLNTSGNSGQAGSLLLAGNGGAGISGVYDGGNSGGAGHYGTGAGHVGFVGIVVMAYS